MTKKEIIRQYIKKYKYFSLTQVVKDTKLEKKIVIDYLYQLKQGNIIFDAGRGIYSSIESVFQLVPESRVETLIKHLKKDFPYTDFVIWNTRQLQPLYHHTQQHHITFVEVEKGSVSAFFERIAKEYRETVTEKRNKSYYDSFDISHNPVVIRNLVSRSSRNGHVPRLEKVLVDMFVDMDKYKHISALDYWKVWKVLCSKYRINMGFIYNYSKRRKCFSDMFPQLIDLYISYGIDLHHLLQESGKNLQ